MTANKPITKLYKIDKQQISVPAPPSPSANRDEQRNFLVTVKSIARNLDLNNLNLLIIYRSTKNWWIIGGRSLLFYQYHLVPEYDLRTLNPHTDTDFYERWPNNPGCASIRDIHGFVGELYNKAADKITNIVNDDSLLVFRLNHKISEKEINVYLNIHRAENDRTNSLLLPKNLFPGTRNACDLFNKALFDKSKNCEAFIRIHLVEEVFTHSNWVAFNFIAMSNGHISPEEYFPKAFEHLNFIQDWFVHIQRYPVLDNHSRAKLAEQLIDLRQRLENDYRIIQVQQAEQSEQVEQAPQTEQTQQPRQARRPRHQKQANRIKTGTQLNLLDGREPASKSTPKLAQPSTKLSNQKSNNLHGVQL